MATVTVNLTGETFDATGALLAYYQGEAATVGGYTIDGVNYPARVFLIGEQGPEIVQLPAGEYDDTLNVEREHPGTGEPNVGVEAPADGTPVEISNDPVVEPPKPRR